MLARLVAQALRRPGFFPTFPRYLEQRFEADGRAARIVHLKLSIALGLVIYNLFLLTDGVLVPDVGSFGFLVRSVILTPGGVLLYFVLDKDFLSCRWRETLVAVAIVVFSLGPLVVFAASDAPNSPFFLPQVLLTLFFGSNVLQLRLVHACILFAVNFVATAIVLLDHPGLPSNLVAVFLAYSACTIILGFICSYAIEKSRRRAYLLALKERLRSEGLSDDRNKLAVLSATDWLTGTANRRSLDDRLDAIWLDPRRSAATSIVLLDIDHFKSFNDFYGHLGGDECLRQLSAVLIEACDQPSVFLARYGGEEFAIAIEGMSEAGAMAFAEDLCARVSKARFPHLGRRDGLSIITVSLGVARVGDEAVADRHSLFAAADKGLYAAKRLGRNRVVRFGSLEMALAASLPSGDGAGHAAKRRRSPAANLPTRIAS